jgi:acetyl-CoA carboxylase carboxyl transferase subunit alpha
MSAIKVDPSASLVTALPRHARAAAIEARSGTAPGPWGEVSRGDLPNPREPWSIVQYSRAPDRPVASFYLTASFDGFVELHGDRRYRDDPSIRGGIAWLERRPMIVVGHERGASLRERERCNFGMPFPEGFHKARRLMQLADRFRLPVVTLIDTPGAYPGLGAEQRGQAHAIAALLECMAGLQVPTVSVIIGQGGSGGALAFALADRLLMFEFAVYSVISPEGCASILWHDEARATDSARALGLTAPELHAAGIVDEIIPEPAGGIARHSAEAAVALRHAVGRHLDALGPLRVADLIRRREMTFATRGAFAVESVSQPTQLNGSGSRP